MELQLILKDARVPFDEYHAWKVRLYGKIYNGEHLAIIYWTLDGELQARIIESSNEEIIGDIVTKVMGVLLNRVFEMNPKWITFTKLLDL